VTHSVVWLSEMGLDVTLIRVHSWRIGSPTDGQIVAGFERLYPTPETEQMTLGPARWVTKKVTERAEERSRAATTVRRLVEAGTIPEDTPLTLVPLTASAAERDAITTWVDEDPARGRATWRNDPVSPIVWEGDGQPWRPTTLARSMLGWVGFPERAVRGPAWWQIPSGVDLAALADGPSSSTRRDWSDLHQLLASIPTGRWTTYGDLATAIGTNANPLGQHVTSCEMCPNAHRVLSAPGRIAPNFRWSDPTKDNVDPRQVLEGEGIHFSETGIADPATRLPVDTLANAVTAVADRRPSRLVTHR
jgi:alkylated DNA nucleotide flippase Atl1